MCYYRNEQETSQSIESIKGSTSLQKIKKIVEDKYSTLSIDNRQFHVSKIFMDFNIE